MSDNMLAEIATLANGRPTGHAVQTLRVWLGQNKIDLAGWTGFMRKDVERWEFGDEKVPALAWEKLVEMVNRRLVEMTKTRSLK